MRKSTKNKINTATTTKAKTPKAAKPESAEAITAIAPIAEIAAPATPAPKAVKAVRELHGIASSYSGVSKSFGKAKSRTRIQTENFGTLLGASLTARDNAFLADLKAKYAGNEFPRCDADAGNMRRAGERGYINYISGDASSDKCIFQLTELALTTKFN